MKNHERIAELADAGYRVEVQHIRYPSIEHPFTNPAGWLAFARVWRQEEGKGRVERTDPVKAITIVDITVGEEKDERLVARGLAFCSPRDEFRRSLGLTIALGRACKDLEAQESLDIHLG